MAERQLVEHGHAERLQVLLEDVLERARAGPVGGLALVTPVAVLHLADEDADRLLQLARGSELRQEPVHVVRRRLDVLEEEERAGEVDLPRSPHRLHEEPQAAADEWRAHLAAPDRPHVRVVGVARDLAEPAAAQHAQQAIAREIGRLGRPHADEAVAVERREPRPLTDRDVERGDVRVPDERLRVRGDRVKVEVWDRLGGAVAALEALDDVDLRVLEEGDEVRRAAARVTGDVVVPVEDAGRELHAVAVRLPPLDAAQDLGARVIRARRRGDADRPSGRQRLAEERHPAILSRSGPGRET